MNIQVVVVSIFCLVPVVCSHADQLAYLEKADAIRAAEDLRNREIAITYCSECDDDKMELWLISHVEAHYTGHESHYEVLLTARPMMESIETLEPAQVASGAPLIWSRPVDQKLRSIPIDLAYTYVWANEEWVCAGLHLGLPCEVSLEHFDP